MPSWRGTRCSIPVVVCLCLAYFTGLTQSQSVGDLLKAGDAALASSEFAAAVRHYTAALALDAAAALIYNKRASAYMAQGNNNAALLDYDKAVDLDPAALGSRLQRGRLLQKTCRFGQAEADFQAILLTRPGHKSSTGELAKISQARQALQAAQTCGAKEQARAELKTLFDIAPFCSEAKLIEAELLLEEQDYGGVAIMTGQVLKADPGNLEALVLRGRTYIHLGDLEVAKRHFSEALRHDPELRQAKAEIRSLKRLLNHKAQAEEAMSQQRWQEADAEYVEAVSICPSKLIKSALLLELCRLRLRVQTDTDGALDACSQALDADPDDEDRAVLKVRALLLAKDYDGAFQEASAARQKHQQSQAIYQVLREAEKAQKMAARKDYYAILGVANDAGDQEIKRAYRGLAMRFHPDKASQAGISAEEAETRFVEIAEAYEVLADGEKRVAYDRGDDIQLGQGQAGYQGHGFPGGFPGGGGQRFHFQFG